jgi:hypothetical protein
MKSPCEKERPFGLSFLFKGNIAEPASTIKRKFYKVNLGISFLLYNIIRCTSQLDFIAFKGDSTIPISWQEWLQ